MKNAPRPKSRDPRPFFLLRIQPFLRHARVARFVLQLLPTRLKRCASREQIVEALRQAGPLFRIDLRVSVVRIAVGIAIDIWIPIHIWITVHIRVAVHIGISIDIRRAVDVWKDSAIATTSIAAVRILRQVAAAIAKYSRTSAADIWRKLRSVDAVR